MPLWRFFQNKRMRAENLHERYFQIRYTEYKHLPQRFCLSESVVSFTTDAADFADDDDGETTRVVHDLQPQKSNQNAFGNDSETIYN